MGVCGNGVARGHAHVRDGGDALSQDDALLDAANARLWRCPTPEILRWYDDNVTANHLEVGPGNGYYLDRCTFPSKSPNVTLLDNDRAALHHSASRIHRHRPRVIFADVCDPLAAGVFRFESVGFNYVLHLLPRNMQVIDVVMVNLRRLLVPGGVIFGATILGSGVEHTRVSRRVNDRNNAAGYFSNLHDSPEWLERTLRSYFDDCRVRLLGCVALFSARRRQGRDVQASPSPEKDCGTVGGHVRRGTFEW